MTGSEDEAKKADELKKAMEVLAKYGQHPSNALPAEQFAYLTNGREFDGSVDWRDFKEHFDARVRMLKLDDTAKVDAITGALTPEVYAAVKRNLDNNMTGLTYDKLDEAMREMYSEEPHLWESRRKFMEATMEEAESVADYHGRLKRLAADCLNLNNSSK